MIKVTLEALDGSPITPRTEKSKVNAQYIHELKEGNYHAFYYDNEDCPSPGVCIYIKGLEQLGNEYKFYDYDNRIFKVTIKAE